MTDSLRTRIAAVQASHHHWDYAGALTCACGEDFGVDNAGWEAAVTDWAQHVADAVIRELDEAIPPIVATAIQGWVLSEWAAISHHGEPSEYEVLKRLDREALQIARYATTHVVA